ncbi:MAG: hypothetical protein GYB68_07230, partial [Chloroflexi bacterium]|nr:hypothetical protein [Chloroflexota bacterium]
MIQRHTRPLWIALFIAAIALFSVTPAQAEPLDQAVNLLVNPSFEEPYYRFSNPDGGGAVATGWEPWWFNDEGPVYAVPEYEIAPTEKDPFRVRSGEAAQMWFRPFILHEAGVYQQVEVGAGNPLRFTVYGHAWSTFCEKEDGQPFDCDYRDSSKGGINPMFMKIGIDPLGGTDAFSESIVWSPVRGAYDVYELFAVEAVAQADTVTVYIYSQPQWPATINNTYWDDAALIITDGSSPPPAPPPTEGEEGDG